MDTHAPAAAAAQPAVPARAARAGSAAAARAVTAVKVYGRGPARLKWHRCRPFRGRTSSAAT